MLRWYLIIKAFWGFNCASNFAFLRPFLFCKGICKVPRCNGLKILAPKHLWKSKIGALQLIWATKRYVTFFLGHPVHYFVICLVNLLVFLFFLPALSILSCQALPYCEPWSLLVSHRSWYLTIITIILIVKRDHCTYHIAHDTGIWHLIGYRTLCLWYLTPTDHTHVGVDCDQNDNSTHDIHDKRFGSFACIRHK